MEKTRIRIMDCAPAELAEKEIMKIRKFLIDLNEFIVMTNEVIDTYQTVI